MQGKSRQVTKGRGDLMLSDRELSEQIIAILRPLATDGSEITAETDLVHDLSLDSLKIMEVMAEIEDRFDISVPLNIVSDIRTVRDVILQIQKLLAEAE
jgi:acyl carrier protein